MTRVSLFSAPFLLGFDTFEERFDRLARATEGYPPYNIERATAEAGDETYRIAIAVAGFSRNDLEVIGEDNQLIVRGRQTEDGARQYLHRGIAQRSFIRRYQLADHVIVTGANLQHGVLRIDLIRELPEEKKPRKIEIGAPAKSEPKLIGKKSASNAA